jgi:hypothetical protein
MDDHSEFYLFLTNPKTGSSRGINTSQQVRGVTDQNKTERHFAASSRLLESVSVPTLVTPLKIFVFPSPHQFSGGRSENRGKPILIDIKPPIQAAPSSLANPYVTTIKTLQRWAQVIMRPTG